MQVTFDDGKKASDSLLSNRFTTALTENKFLKQIEILV